jgi:hypothetical protein
MFDIELVPYMSQEDVAIQARTSPDRIQAYICNCGAHWFTIRRFGGQYFDLNSFFNVPQLLSKNMMLQYINTIQENDYSVFIVNGNLDPCLADQQLGTNPIGLSEYRSLTKDLQKMVMDGKVIGNPKDLEGRKTVHASIPKEFYDELRKNPKNPYIRQQIIAQLPAELAGDDVPDDLDCPSTDHIHFNRHVTLYPMKERKNNEKNMRSCNCIHCHPQPPVKTEHLPPKMTDKPLSNNPNEPHQQTRVVQVVRQYVVDEIDPDDPDQTPKPTVVTTSTILVQRLSPGRNNAVTNNQPIEQLNRPSIGFHNDDEDFFQQAMAASLLNTPEMNDDIDMSVFEERAERLNQNMLDLAIAASLIDQTESAIKQIEQTPLPTMNSSSTPTINSEPMSLENPPSYFPPPLTNTHSSSPPKNTNSFPPTDTNSFLPTNTNSLSPTNTHSPPLTNTHSSLPRETNSHSPKDTYSPPPTTTFSTPPIVTETDPMKSPSIEGKSFEIIFIMIRESNYESRSLISFHFFRIT